MIEGDTDKTCLGHSAQPADFALIVIVLFFNLFKTKIGKVPMALPLFVTRQFKI